MTTIFFFATLSHMFLAFFWDLWCICSLIGIWPRFIEPQLLVTKRVALPDPAFTTLRGTKLLLFSDLHFSKKFSKRRLKRLQNTIRQLQPDLILFAGDFINHSSLEDGDRLKQFLCSLRAPLGTFAVLGNHDYASYVSPNREGNYDVKESKNRHFLTKSLARLFSQKNPSPIVTKRAEQVGLHQALMHLLKESDVRLLHNESVVLNKEGRLLQLVGLGDYWLGKCCPASAFLSVDPSLPTLILSHNPDTTHFLQEYHGHAVFCGHTHGSQVNIPLIRTRLRATEDPHLRRGLYKKNKWIYITRGVGSHQNFRWFSPPELTLITLC